MDSAIVTSAASVVEVPLVTGVDSASVCGTAFDIASDMTRFAIRKISGYSARRSRCGVVLEARLCFVEFVLQWTWSLMLADVVRANGRTSRLSSFRSQPVKFCNANMELPIYNYAWISYQGYEISVL